MVATMARGVLNMDRTTPLFNNGATIAAWEWLYGDDGDWRGDAEARDALEEFARTARSSGNDPSDARQEFLREWSRNEAVEKEVRNVLGWVDGFAPCPPEAPGMWRYLMIRCVDEIEAAEIAGEIIRRVDAQGEHLG